MRKIKLCPILLLIVILMFAFFVGNVKASGTKVFVIAPNQEVVEYVNLWGSGNASGVLSVTTWNRIEVSEDMTAQEYIRAERRQSVGFCRIDFLIKDPDGVVIQKFLNVSTTPFSFTANKPGNYSLWMVNTYEAFNVSVELDYGIELVFYATETLGISSSASMSTQIAPTIVYFTPHNPEDDEGSDYVVGLYLTMQGAGRMLGIINSGSSLLPLRSVNLTSLIAGALALLSVASIELWGRRQRFGLLQITYRERVLKIIGYRWRLGREKASIHRQSV